jgi:hypothetical protein
MKPDVPPGAHGETVAEPLVCELVRDEALGAALPVDVICAEHRQALRLKWDLEVVVGDDDRVVGKRKGPDCVATVDSSGAGSAGGRI